MRLPSRRDALVSALVAAGLSQPPRRASAAYTIVPTGSISEKRERLVVVEKDFAKTPDNPYVFGEKAQLESDISVLERNREFTQRISREVAAGSTVFPQSLTIGVPDMAAAVTFWTRGVGCLVLSTTLNADGANVTRVGFGSQSLGKEDGAEFALELVESPQAGLLDVQTSVVQYVQLAIPIFRISQVMAYGGEILSAYGWTEVLAPGGLPLRVHIDETRRDPFEFVALRVSDVKRVRSHYEALGMRVVAEEDAKRKIKLGGAYGLALENKDAFEPDREPGALQLSFAEPALTTGLLLLPPRKRGARLSIGSPPAQLRLVGTAPAAAAEAGELTSPDGLRSCFISADAFERALTAG